MVNSISRMKSSRRRAGVSLIEAVISALLVGSLAVTSLQATQAILRAQRELNHQRQAYALCEQFLTEVLQARYSPAKVSEDGAESDVVEMDALPTNEIEVLSNPSRSSLLYLDQFHGRLESPPQNRDGSVMTGFGRGWKVAIDVQRFKPTQSPAATAEDLGLKRVSVTVTDPTGTQITLNSFRARLGCNERTPSQPCEFIQSVGLSLRLQGDSVNFRGGVKPMDLAPLKGMSVSSVDDLPVAVDSL
jgi:Tfp pilus assembly protein PilV